MLSVGMCNKSDVPTLCSPSFLLRTTCSSKRPVADAIGILFFSHRLDFVSLLLFLCVAIPSPDSLKIYNQFKHIPTTHFPLPRLPFTLPSTSFYYSPPIFFQPHNSHLLQPDLKSRSRNRKPDFAKRSVDSTNQLDYYPNCSITQSNYPSISRNFARWFNFSSLCFHSV